MNDLSNIKTKKTPIKIAGEEKYLHYNLNAFAELEEIYGTIDAAMNELSKGSVKSIINILRAGLLHENEKLTAKKVGEMFDLSEISYIGERINTAISQAMPEANENEEQGTDSKKK